MHKSSDIILYDGTQSFSVKMLIYFCLGTDLLSYENGGIRSVPSCFTLTPTLSPRARGAKCRGGTDRNDVAC
jgi:hypothetical protein